MNESNLNFAQSIIYNYDFKQVIYSEDTDISLDVICKTCYFYLGK